MVSTGTPGSPNINYGYAGDKDSIGLQSVMDDGQFTKFLLKKGADMPQVCCPMALRPWSTNAVVGDYVVVERLDSMFVLRDANTAMWENLANPYKRTVTRGARDGGGA